jgi:hypothetical protein
MISGSCTVPGYHSGTITVSWSLSRE